jgi:type II restriction enzyme
MSVKEIHILPKQVLGAAWGPQKERMESAIFFPLYLVLKKSEKEYSVFYLPTDFQDKAMFVPRAPLSNTAKRAGWQGFIYNLSVIKEGAFVKLL